MNGFGLCFFSHVFGLKFGSVYFDKKWFSSKNIFKEVIFPFSTKNILPCLSLALCNFFFSVHFQRGLLSITRSG
jgi:hypothetical protein